MSAFVVSARHIDYLVTAYARWVGLTADLATLSRWAHMLELENVRSVNFRYAGSRHVPITETPDPRLVWSAGVGELAPVQVLKAVGCFQYQACETPDWEETEARRWTDELEAAAIARLPGYDGRTCDAPWEHVDRMVNACMAWGWRGHDPDEMTEIAHNLELECVRSTNADIRGRRDVPLDLQPSKRDVPFLRSLDPVHVLNEIACYDHHVCGSHRVQKRTRDWLDSLRSAAIGALPGYENAKWEVA